MTLHEQIILIDSGDFVSSGSKNSDCSPVFHIMISFLGIGKRAVDNVRLHNCGAHFYERRLL